MAIQVIHETGIYTETVGSGTPILMLHGGLGLDHTYFRPRFDQLSNAAQVIYYDHRGNGRSDRPDDYSSLTLDLLVDDAAHVLDHYGLDQAVVFGHSYGGFIGQLFAIKYPNRLSGLILSNTVPAFDYQPMPNGTEEQLAAFGAAFTRPMESDEDWRATWSTMWQMYFKTYDPVIGAEIDAATVYAGQAWNAGSAALATYNTLEGLPSIEAKTLVLSGAHDFVCPPDHGGSRIQSLMPNATHEILADSAHYPFIEEEEAYFSILNDFLASL